jgi:hypothetical protein
MMALTTKKKNKIFIAIKYKNFVQVVKVARNHVITGKTSSAGATNIKHTNRLSLNHARIPPLGEIAYSILIKLNLSTSATRSMAESVVRLASISGLAIGIGCQATLSELISNDNCEFCLGSGKLLLFKVIAINLIYGF